MATPARNIHRIGGGTPANLRLKLPEADLTPPGISVLEALTPVEAAEQMRAAFPAARNLHRLAATVGSTSVDAIRAAGFDVIPVPTRAFPNHHRIIHPDGAAGFTDDILARLSAAFMNSSVETDKPDTHE